ncbi:MAG: hypothetical protein ABJA37_02955 [Ferruginibacter sp.]
MNIIFRICIIAMAIVSATSCKNNTQPKVLVFTEQDSKKVIEREISSWEFAKTRNLPALREVLADDYVGFFGTNIMHPNDVVKLFQNSIVRSYHLSNIRVQPVTDNVAIVYYELNQDIIDASGDTWTPHVASAATYVKRNGVWHTVFYQETVINN